MSVYYTISKVGVTKYVGKQQNQNSQFLEQGIQVKLSDIKMSNKERFKFTKPKKDFSKVKLLHHKMDRENDSTSMQYDPISPATLANIKPKKFMYKDKHQLIYKPVVTTSLS